MNTQTPKLKLIINHKPFVKVFQPAFLSPVEIKKVKDNPARQLDNESMVKK